MGFHPAAECAQQHAREWQPPRSQRRRSTTTCQYPSDASERQQKQEEKWRRKAARDSCEECLDGFGVFLWKHSCRACERVLCDTCCRHRDAGDSRVCDNCIVKMETADIAGWRPGKSDTSSWRNNLTR